MGCSLARNVVAIVRIFTGEALFSETGAAMKEIVKARGNGHLSSYVELTEKGLKTAPKAGTFSKWPINGQFKNGGSGGARTRNLCRDRAAL